MFVRSIVAIALSALVLIATLQPRLAQEIFTRVFSKDQFKVAFRRASFYLRRSWMKLNFSKDMVYIFCDGLSVTELKALRAFLLRRERHFEAGLVAGDLSYVSAMLTIQSVGHEEYQTQLETFANDADKVLFSIENSPAKPTHAPAKKTDQSFDIASAHLALSAFSEFMKSEDLPWFVLSGTLLGIVREGGFLPHDYDIDVGIYSDTCDLNKFSEALQQHPDFHGGYLDTQIIFHRDETGQITKTEKPVFMKVAHVSGVHIDVFVHHIDGDITWHGSSLFRWDNSNFDLTPYHLGETSVYGPKDADRYLTENYGNWRVPVTEFHSAIDTTNQQVVSNPLSLAVFLRRVWLSKTTNPQDAAALMNLLEHRGFVEAGGTHFIRNAFM